MENKLIELINKSNYHIYAYNSPLNSTLTEVLNLFNVTKKTVFLVLTNNYKATKSYEKLVDVLGLDKVNLYLMDDFTTQEILASSKEYEEERLFTISSIIKGEAKIIVTSISSIMRPIQSKDEFKNGFIKLNKGDEIEVNSFLDNLVRLGYKRESKVESSFEFSVRGEIIDLFPLGYDHPIRIDLFGDEIESIKEFNEQTQRSIKDINDVLIYPASEIIINDNLALANLLRDKLKGISEAESDILDIENRNYSLKTLKYLNYYEDNPCSILDYLEDKIICINDIVDAMDIELHLNENAYSSINADILKKIDASIYFELRDILIKNNIIYFQEFKKYIDLELTDLCDFDAIEVASYNGNLKLFYDQNRDYKEILIYLENEKFIELVNSYIESNKIKNIKVIKGKAFSVGYVTKRRLIISEDELFRHLEEKNKKYRTKDMVQLTSSDELEIGDYVVHYDYGIAKYLGLKTIELKGIKNDYLNLLFDGSELMVPVENIGILDKYQGSEGHIPHLSKIGSKKWEKKKGEIKEKLYEIARDLIATQAKRNESIGVRYDADTLEQELFEQDFEYELTLDQAEAISIIKKEMESGKIIDRLICGDVGYGKTEVAMRIAFKTVMQGLQVAYLAPTTILSRQHYYTFKERMQDYGICVEIINRFVSPKEIERIKSGLIKGSIDIVIGTHALLNKSIEYKNLGLLIIDEEQRFGVEHKERIKKLKSNVNVLTLSATPIPRTLQMALVGVRDLSLISTPPKNRFPVKTYVLEENDIVIKEAIYQELARGGQVFYLHNRVDDLARVEEKIKKLVPEARTSIGHGQMNKEVLEDIVQSFIDRNIDILICTTIIETGIDIPNSNTLIVDEANRLGLAQMYQLRGRVGRSDRLSYAYFTYPKRGTLSEDSIKRLNAIKEFTSLGSGYKIALRDLSIRGAGDILGKEQSGFIDDVGLDLYMRLLDEEVKALNGETVETKTSPTWGVEVSKHISDDYVSDEDIKIYIHKKINEIGSNYTKEDLILELEDRFGKVSEELMMYIEKKYLDYLISYLDIVKFNDYLTYVQLMFSEEVSSKIDPSEMFSIAYNLSSNFSFEYKEKKIIVKYNKKQTKLDWLVMLNKFLELCIKLL